MDVWLLGFSGLREIRNIHPVFVHFPIGLLPSALLLYALGLALRRPTLRAAGRACLYLATIAAAAAVATGLRTEGSFPVTAQVGRMIETHGDLAVAVLAAAAFLSIWSFWHKDHSPRRAGLFLILLALANLVLLQAADLGGRMVFVQGAAVRCPAAAASAGR
ncbi:MAG: DUF2231 domain-containing protein [Elusimicrobia bacterium]|nr:DUF2231 domain-containing protein [Elusimicrobiota bacterium]